MGQVMTAVLGRPDRRNAVDAETADALVLAFEKFDQDSQAAVAIF